WLIIVDNADVDTFFGPSQLYKYLPHNSRGCVLILTRNRQLALRIICPAQLIHMNGMEQRDARNLLSSFTGQPSDDKDANDLVSALDYLPLAIAQAGVFVALNSMSVHTYLQQLIRNDESASELYLAGLSHFFSTMHCTNQYQSPIASLSDLRNYNSDASDVLAVMSCFHLEDVPIALLSTFSDPVSLFEALAILKAYSLIRPGSGCDTVELHPLARAMARSEVKSKTKHSHYLELALKAMNLNFPAISEQPSLLERCGLY
ncbi:hypothetical protein K505DRAFT_239581, partial [Melanomma pulvis-pyrius CBS 109.77]